MFDPYDWLTFEGQSPKKKVKTSENKRLTVSSNSAGFKKMLYDFEVACSILMRLVDC